jgi:hypothetical protein
VRSYRTFLRGAEEGMALPAVLMLLVLLAGVTAIISEISVHHQKQIVIEQAVDDTYLAAEGAVNKQIADMSVLSGLWDQKTNLSSSPSGYTSYSPIAFTSTNGIPTCTSGVACHRNMYPVGGGLIKNLGPVNGDGETVDSSYSIIDQLDPSNLPDADLTLNGVKAWTQVERLDETFPGTATVGGSLSNAVAEGGNSKAVRYRITGISTKSVKGRRGYATVIAVAEVPAS